jgi:hypothetical protein
MGKTILSAGDPVLTEDLNTRRLSITVKDQHGRLLAGARIVFEVEGEEIVVDDSDGHGSVIRPAGSTQPTPVRVTWEGATKTERIAYGQNAYTFNFTVDEPKPPKRRPLILGVVVVGAIVAVALVVIIRPNEDPGERIARQCAGGRTISNESAIASGLSEQLTELKSGASVKSSDVGALAASFKPDGFGVELYKAYTACLQQQTENYLRLKGVNVLPSPPPPQPSEPKAKPSASPGGVGVGGVGNVRGWSYYEELDGRPTHDGVLMPPGLETTPPYAQVKVGQIFKSRRGFKIRNAPHGSAEIVESAPAAKCVKVLSAPKNPIRVNEATSGGYLEVARIACPETP